MTRRTRWGWAATLAFGGWALTGCDDDGGDGQATADCRQAVAACAPGFVCTFTQVAGYACVPDEGRADATPGAGGTPGAGDNPGAGGEPGAGGGPDQDAGVADDRVDVSNVRVREAEPNEAGDAYIVFAGRMFRLTFDYAIRQGPDCESCRAQIVLGVNGEGVQCLYDGSPGLAGVTDRVDGQVTAPAESGRLALTWKRLDFPDCEDALAAFADATDAPGGALATIEVKQPLGPYQWVGDNIEIPLTQDRYCFERDCPAGTFALFGSGGIGGEHDMVTDMALDDDTWLRCFVGELPEGAARNTPFTTLCAEAPGATIERVEVQQAARQDGVTQIEVRCPEGYRVLHGGGAWPLGWKVGRRSFFRQGETEGFFLIGRGTAGMVTAQATCASDVPPITEVEERATILPGGNCGGVTCPDGTIPVGGGAVLPDELELESFGPDNRRMNVCGLNSRRPDLTFEVFGRCLPRD